MRSARIVVASLVVIALVTAVAAARTDGTDPPGSPSNPLVALPNPTPTRIPPPTREPTNEAPRQADGTQLGAPSKSADGKTQNGSVAMHDGKQMAAPAQTTRQQKEVPPSASRPCSLVTRAQAQEIIGAPIVEPLEAPQGPTCIYSSESGKSYVTITAQDASVEQLRRELTGSQPVSVAGRAGYCGTRGGPVLYAALSERRTLVVGAPCSIATRLAALALGRT